MAEALHVLVVDDETDLADVVAGYLRREGFSVDLAHDGPGAVAQARLHAPDLVVLDIMLPGFDGIEVCRQLRGFSDAYVIMLTAKDEEVDKVIGLSVGADDYLVKPFSPRELIARVKAMLRRPRTGRAATHPGAPVLRFADVVVDLESRQVTRAEEAVPLTRTEFDLLATLAERPRAAFTRRQLLDSAWGEGWYGDEHVVDVHIAHVRDKLGDDATTPRYIRTVRGIGYGLVSP
ncbi:response regulator transcription factor [Terrabacter terrae]|uniref:Response regulator transcription factor n=1 Tax=Terrabacter terrae TaxID=318434 RepID=A0ABN2TZU8_9MICO